jgi:hypothetical protein
MAGGSRVASKASRDRLSAPRATPEAHGKALFDKLEGTVLPLFHRDPAGWTRVMKGAISKVGAVFSAHRMMRRYAAEAYLSCAGWVVASQINPCRF